MKPTPALSSSRARVARSWFAGTCVLGLAAGLFALARSGTAATPPDSLAAGAEVIAVAASSAQAANRLPDDALDGGLGWINTRGPIHLPELRGKVVLLDFWTYCCINCHHILPDLEKLEQKYANELVVIGVHTAKFDAERNTENIRKKVAEYRIRHPVINDADQVLWRKFGVNAWPTLVLIDALGRYQGFVSGEGHYKVLDEAIGKLVAGHRARGELNETPLYFEPEADRPHDAPLLFPGKILADAPGKRLFISDTGHNRIVITDLEGTHQATVGSGLTGHPDGSYDQARFNRPQGMCLIGETLYVADTENHMIRAVDLKTEQVTTVAGVGAQSYRRRGSGPALKTGLNSPWDVLPDPGNPQRIYIAMAGPHQIWVLDLDREAVGVWAGSGVENIIDGTRSAAAFAQPSGLATDGTYLYVADSEVSGIRAVTLDGNRVQTVVGMGLFEFGDVDGRGDAVRLQHCLGLAYGDGSLYIADTYNNKIKVCDPKTRSVRTFVGTHQAGLSDDPPQFDDPGGLSLAGKTLYVADTNNHAIRAVDLESRAVRTLALSGVSQPSPPEQPPSFPNATVVDVPAVKVAPGDRFTLQVRLAMPEGYKVNPDAPMPYLLETPDREGALAESVSPTGGRIEPPAESFPVEVPLAKAAKGGESLTVRLSVSAFLCEEVLCEIHSYTWNVPVRFAVGGTSTIELSSPPTRTAAR